jgi:hypothetical protein
MEETSFDLISYWGFCPFDGISGGLTNSIEFCAGFWIGGVCGFLGFPFTAGFGGLAKDSFTSS